MFYNNLYNSGCYNRSPLGGNNNNSGNGFNGGNYTFLLQSKVDHTIKVTTNPYNITLGSNETASFSSITYIAEVPTTILLPVMNQYIDKVSINIINRSNGLVNVQTQNDELMYNSSYLPANGANTLNLTRNKFCKFIVTQTENKYSYILLLA